MNTAFSSKKGFTIVELLIVIVVIGILATITIVAYNGVQERARFVVMQTDLKSITQALTIYKADVGRYPASVGRPNCNFSWCGWSQAQGDFFIVGLSPTYMTKIPQMAPNGIEADTYLYRASDDGADYQLIRFKATGLSTAEMTNNPLLATGNGYDGLAWGYKTNAGGWW